MTSFPPPPPSCVRFAELDTESPPFCGPASQWRADSQAESDSCRRPLVDATQVSSPPTGRHAVNPPCARLPPWRRGGRVRVRGAGWWFPGAGGRAPAAQAGAPESSLGRPGPAAPAMESYDIIANQPVVIDNVSPQPAREAWGEKEPRPAGLQRRRMRCRSWVGPWPWPSEGRPDPCLGSLDYNRDAADSWLVLA